MASPIPHRHLHKIHLLTKPDRLGPAVENPADLPRREVAPRRLEPRARRRDGVRSPPAVSSLAPVAGTVLGTVRKIESGARRASSSIHSIPLASQTFPISWLSQKIVV